MLSTIHTNDSLSAVSRLQDMGIEPFLLALDAARAGGAAADSPAVQGVQRALRVRRRDREPHGLESGQHTLRAQRVRRCRGTGYRGRVGVFEVVRITDRMADLIQTEHRCPNCARRPASRE